MTTPQGKRDEWLNRIVTVTDRVGDDGGKNSTWIRPSKYPKYPKANMHCPEMSFFRLLETTLYAASPAQLGTVQSDRRFLLWLDRTSDRVPDRILGANSQIHAAGFLEEEHP